MSVEPADNDFPERIIDWWLGRSGESPQHAEQQRKIWYTGGDDIDARIHSEFGEQVRLACDSKLNDWQSTPQGTLALIILLDQFTRNMYRGTIDAYRGDALAYKVATRAIERGDDRALSVTGSIFIYHPFHHSEALADQDHSVRLLEQLHERTSDEWKPYVAKRILGFTRHRDIVARFGRFPHRNRVYERANTAAETEYLQGGPETFGQG